MEIYQELCQDSEESSSTDHEGEVDEESEDEVQIQENPLKEFLPETNPELGGLETMEDVKRWVAHLIEEDAEDDRLHQEGLAALVKEQAEARTARRAARRSRQDTRLASSNFGTIKSIHINFSLALIHLEL